MSTLTPETFRALVNQIVTRRFFLTSEEGSLLRREDRKTYNEYFSVYYDVELSELLQVLLLQGNRLDADGPIARRLLQRLKMLIQDLDAFRVTRWKWTPGEPALEDRLSSTSTRRPAQLISSSSSQRSLTRYKPEEPYWLRQEVSVSAEVNLQSFWNYFSFTTTLSLPVLWMTLRIAYRQVTDIWPLLNSSRWHLSGLRRPLRIVWSKNQFHFFKNFVPIPTIRNDISTNAQTLKHNINNVCNLIKLKQAI